MTAVAVVDDHPGIRQTFCDWINATAGFRCVCVCASAEEAVVEIPRHKPEIVLMDINMPGESGIACTARLRALVPTLQIIMVTVYRDQDLIFRALEAGASGYLLKRSQPEELIRAIEEVRSGGAPMTSEIARMVVEAFQKKPAGAKPSDDLTERESQILHSLSQGLSNKEIASAFDISYDTVRNHLRHIYEKLHVRGRTEAVKKYFQAGTPGISRSPLDPS